MLIKEDYQKAINVLDACNLSGVVHGFSCVMKKIHFESIKQNKGTDFKNTHPIVVLYAEKIAQLTRLMSHDIMVFHEAYQICKERAETQTKVIDHE